MDKQEYLRLLSQASVNDTSKFRAVPLERPKSKGRPPKYYHPLLEKEKLVESTVRRILPSAIADSARPTGSRLAHLYGLPKTHKRQLAMRPILSATGTYNYALAKWLDAMLKPFVIGFLGNVLVIRIVHKTREMHSVTNYLLANLAVSDGLSIFSLLPPMLPHDFFPKLYCRLMNLKYLILPVSSFTLMVLAIERYHALLKPFRTVLRLKQENVKRAIAIIWISSVLTSLPNVIIESKFSDALDTCRPSSEVYFFIWSSMVVYIRYVLPQFFYRIYLDKTICASPADRQEDRACEKKKLVITFMLATAGFVVGYGPCNALYTLVFIGATQGNYFSVLSPVVKFTYLFSLCLNPFLYAFRSTNFRQGFKRIIFCRLPQIQNEMLQQP
ncbi:allatostatin-A receptor-like [Montipora capricornis]|uniref:allatostatin-A receptor-like n=1 Tax=Montipora capricornis TaxID=246305 RepID=UPI0035F134CE